MATGYVGILTVELHFPESGSLKGKRKYVKSAKAHLHERFGASVAEVDHHELWQRSTLAVACATREHRELQELLDAVGAVPRVAGLGARPFRPGGGRPWRAVAAAEAGGRGA